ncbi:hypothetical protein P171DRAFT_490180 [Karstenula rhodostoma CBS 690.94]|uniref:Uncharacterized protein n=1 Tax=Karstenula rhodostoma CBS 690.94 TaxID=1392251 RepID=A0A9P4P6V4_9PLEO|nr:hypothetical protein P171DRAFT_490180 [Karstenula rhodostoma CBS 690.94]
MAGWRKLKDIGCEEGIVAVAYDESKTAFNRRIHQFSMTDGAAVFMNMHLRDPDGDQPGRAQVFAGVYRKLTSRDPKDAWTSGQWMTERTGGSDVSGTETVAHRLTPEEINRKTQEGGHTNAVGMPLGPWKIDGFKWFSSATDSEISVLLPAMKAQISVASVHGLRNCMECLGEVGYCENNDDGGLLNIAISLSIRYGRVRSAAWLKTVRVILDKRLGNGDVVANIFAP